jgi:hypothetical protein
VHDARTAALVCAPVVNPSPSNQASPA